MTASPTHRNAAFSSLALIALLATVGLSADRSAASVPAMETVDLEPLSLSLSLTRLTPDVLERDGNLGVGVSVTNTGVTLAAGLSVSVTTTVDPLTDREQLASWERGELARPMREVARVSVGGPDGIPPDHTEFASLSSSASSILLADGTVGVYGVSVTLEGSGEPLSTIRSFLTWLDGEPNVVPVSILVLASESTERIDALLDTVGRPEVAFAVDPTLLSPTAISRLASLDTYLLPAHNIDLASLARAGSSGLLDRALARARADAPLSLAAAPWLGVSANIDQPVVALASDRGAAAIVCLPAFTTTLPDLDTLDPVPPALALTSGNGPTVPILIPDSGLSTALIAGPPGSSTTPARMTAEIALLATANTTQNPVLVVAGPSWSIESNHRSGTLKALLDSPWVRLTRIASVLDHGSPATIVLPASNPSDTDIPIPLLTAAGSSLRGLDALASGTPDPDSFSLPLTSLVLGSFSLDKRTDPVARDAFIETAVATVDDVRSAISIPGSSTLNLISRSGNIPVTVTNALSVEVTVTVVLESRSPILLIEEHPSVTVPAESSTQVLVPVTAVSSGNVAVRVSLANSDGTRLTPVTELSLRIRAAWGDLFTVIAAGLGLLLLVAGIVRTIRRGRADTRQGPSDEPEEVV